MENDSEILINSFHVTHDDFGDSYEFVLNDQLQVMECIKIDAINNGELSPIEDAPINLDGMLFELNHVRVNPKVDNTHIIECLTDALNNIGVLVSNPPASDSMAMCFKPLGEISDNVRFYLNTKAEVIFLSPSTRPKLVSSNNIYKI
jgi:hypothetical protein